ncbi:hypothetical protein C2W62_52930 [Candidatus Entotheonella serta]|nr:hypothetical protein C2W62_52930 [Candidatus Entotheonella serta]
MCPLSCGQVHRVHGGSIDIDPEGLATLRTPEGLAIDFFRVPEPKTVKNRLHLDLRSREFTTRLWKSSTISLMAVVSDQRLV